VANFATVADVEAFLQLELTGDQTVAVERALTEATAAIRNYCRQHISLVEDDEVTLYPFGGYRLFLPELPVLAVSVVEEDGTLLEASGYVWERYGVLLRYPWARWVAGNRTVRVVYDHGYATIPDDVVAVATRAAARAFQAGMRAAEAGGVMGISSKSLGDFSVSYTAEGGAAEGIMGASAARMLLMSEKEILNRYRI
jgi:hypothetical protein